ncbi:hypothetical protein ACFZEN_004713 [Salmonella enterica]
MSNKPGVSWSEAETLTDNLDTEIRNLVENPTSDNAVCLVRSVMEVCRATSQTTQEYPETLPCPVHLVPGLRFGKGCKTEGLLIALQRRAEYYAGLDAMTPEERMKYNDNIEAIRQLLPQPESPVTVLCLALERMLKMHELVMNKTNAGAGFYDAECIREMNLAPIQAWQALTFARSKQ